MNTLHIFQEALMEVKKELTYTQNNEPRSNSCDLCGKTYHNKKNHDRHIAVTHFGNKDPGKKKEISACDFCDKTFSNNQQHKKHIREIHQIEQIKPHKCDQCDKTFAQKCNLLTHKKHLHGIGVIKKYKCNECNKEYNVKYRLQRHISSIHERRKDHKCNLCGEAFVKNDSLIDHMKAFHDENRKTYYCNFCSKKCFTDQRLKNHIKRVHTTNEFPRIYCNVCGKIFKTKKYLQAHVEIQHNKDGKYKDKVLCDICKKTFVADYLENHVETHYKDIDLFTCDICEKSYKYENFLKRHWNTYHAIDGKERYQKEKIGNNQIKQNNLASMDYQHSKLISSQDEKSIFIEKAPSYKENKTQVNKSHKCHLCEKLFDSTNNLKIHKQTVHDQRIQFSCRYCDDGKNFSNKQSLERHNKKFHQQKYCITCNYCEKNFMMHKTLEKHIKNSHLFECHVCNETFTRFDQLSKHKKDIHNIFDKDMKSRCDICDIVFKEPKKLKDHIEVVHEGMRLTCNYCIDDKMFAGKRSLQLHIAGMHKDRNEIKCHNCEKTFPRKNALQRHIRDIHENKREEECHICNKTFKRPYRLTEHLATVHNFVENNKIASDQHYGVTRNGRIKKYICDICEKAFSQSANLNTHKKWNHSQKPGTLPKHKCNICSKHFNGKNLLNSHLKMYHEKGDFQCRICQKELQNKASLLSHIRNNHKEEKHECIDCNLSFRSVTSLKNHYLKSHKNPTKPIEETFDNSNKDFKTIFQLPDPLKTEPDIKWEPCEPDPLAISVHAFSKLEPIKNELES